MKLEQAIEQFVTNLAQVRHLGTLHDIVVGHTDASVDAADILRAQIVLAVSAFDQYIHELVRLGMLLAYQGEREETRKFGEFRVSIASMRDAITSPEDCLWLEAEIRREHKIRSFQKSKNVKNVMNYLTDRDVWEEVSGRLGDGQNAIKTQLDLIVDRRDQIAHQADINPTDPGVRWPIDVDMVNNSVNFMEKIAVAIYEIVRT